MNTCMHCCISGLVQGVFFRASARDEARRLGLAGWVRNLPDGRVEVFACGEKEPLDALLAWLHEGPPHANVSGVEVDWREQEQGTDHADFEVR